jgi:hypothetical protein
MNAPLVQNFQPLDQLESRLVDSWRAVTRAEHRFLELLREFDLRQDWREYGNSDCAEWLNWRCGICRTTAQEKVRVARALWFLPQIGEAFRRGDLSYSNVRALTRAASDATEAELLAFVLDASAAQCEAFCRGPKNADPVASAADARRLHESGRCSPRARMRWWKWRARCWWTNRARAGARLPRKAIKWWCTWTQRR